MVSRLIYQKPLSEMHTGTWTLICYLHSTLQVYYSKNDEPLKAVTSALSNNNAGGGQYQIGILKKPTGTSDVVNSGYQEKGIKEGQIYGGIFLEDSANACVSL